MERDPSGEVDEAKIDRYLRERICDVVTLNTPTGEVLFRREGVSARTGVDDETIEGTQVLHRMHPDDLTRLVAEVENISRTPDASVIMTARVRHAHDHELWQSCTFRMFNAIDTLGGILAMIDIDRNLGDHDAVMSADPAFAMAHAAPIGLALLGEKNDVLFTNDVMTTLTGLTHGPIEKTPATPDVRNSVDRLIRDCRAVGPQETTLHLGDRSVRVRVARMREERGELIVSASDVTTEVAARAAAQRSERIIRTVFDHTPAAVAILDLDGVVKDVNVSWSALTGLGHDESIGHHYTHFLPEHAVAQGEEDLRALLAGEVESVRREVQAESTSAPFEWADVRLALLRDEHERPTGLIGQVLDISDRKAIESAQHAREIELERSAHTDHLTGVANRRLLERHLHGSMARGRRSDVHVAVLYCDLDRFKPVNDQHGHAAGDVVLKELARRFQETVRDGDLVARVGGDEFVVVLESIDEPDRAEIIRKRIIAAATAPVRIGTAEVSVGISVGVAVVEPDDDAGTAIDRADRAAYVEKRRHRAEEPGRRPRGR